MPAGMMFTPLWPLERLRYLLTIRINSKEGLNLFPARRRGDAKEGYGGAKRMIDDGALEDPRPDVLIGLPPRYLEGEFYAGDIGYHYSGIMACMDRFEILVKGKGSHGAYPHGSIDPISIACQIILNSRPS